MNNWVDTIEQHKAEIAAFSAKNADDMEQFRIRYLGSKGIVKAVMGGMKDLAPEARKNFGLQVNALKQLAEQKYEELREAHASSTSASQKSIDQSLPGDPLPLGGRHPISLVQESAIRIFEHLGFRVAEGPEIEDDWHNFTALNLPEDHPARDMQDTFYISRNPDWLLRTHTSSVQVRAMKQQALPIRIICPGRVYRNETISARAHCFFHQIEGLYIAENVSFADLKQTLYFFVREMFGEGIQIRFRPSYFPFTEPSAEMDISCLICKGKGCNVCKHSGWVEILGCGMVHPKVLENCGIDPEKYTGFAFGMGVERMTMLKFQIKDLRLFSENDVRFLRQFISAS